MSRRIKWTDEQIEYLKSNYLYHSWIQLSEILGINETVIRRKAIALGLVSKSKNNPTVKSKKVRVEHQFGMDICKLLHMLHWEQEMSVKQMEKELGVVRQTIYTWMEECGIKWRGQSEATATEWKNRPEKRKDSFKATQSKAQKIKAKKYPNPMLGRTGSLHHRWKGGKREYNTTRSLNEGSWCVNRKLALERDNYTCQLCGAKGDGVIIDVHHIVKVRDGGSNLVNNLVCYCRPCHMKTDENLKATKRKK